MHHKGTRTARIASTLQSQLGNNIVAHYPSFGKKLFSITYIQVSPDLSYADIFCSCKEDVDILPMVTELNTDAKYIRHAILQGSPLRKFPQLRFHADKVSHTSRRIDTLLAQIKKQPTSHTAE